MSDLAVLAAEGCHVPLTWVEETVRLGPSRVKLLRIPKRNSSKLRVIARPSAELEVLQRWLTLNYFNRLPVHDCAIAFKRSESILTNARRHRESKYFLRVDFTDFFQSIQFSDFLSVLRSQEKFAHLVSTPSSSELIRQVCFDKKGRLPIGYSSSPAISNAVMLKFDVELTSLVHAGASNLGRGVLTRYADDIVFSTDAKGGCNEFLKLLQSFVQKWASPQLKINSKKTIFSSKAGGSAMVTGLRICSDGHITVTREYKDQLRLMLSLYARERLKAEDVAVLQGHLAHVRNVAPSFFSKMCSKFMLEIKRLSEG